MLKKHNDIKCPCNYCVKLREYVNHKRMTHNFKKYIESDYAVYSDRTPSFDNEQYLAMKRKVKQLKIQKDQLKLLLPDEIIPDFAARGVNVMHH